MDKYLKEACEVFINHVSQSLTTSLKNVLSKFEIIMEISRKEGQDASAMIKKQPYLNASKYCAHFLFCCCAEIVFIFLLLLCRNCVTSVLLLCYCCTYNCVTVVLLLCYCCAHILFPCTENVRAAVAETNKLLKAQIPQVKRSLALYLSNEETEHILFRPIRVSSHTHAHTQNTQNITLFNHKNFN